MDVYERSVVVWVTLLVFILIAGMIGCEHQSLNVVPQKMAEKGFCWSTSPTAGQQGSYQPCPTVPLNVER